MKQQHIFLFFISFYIISLASFSQKTKKDTIVIKDIYGLRVGIDLYNPIYTLIDSKRKGLELTADFRLSNKYFIAAEFGYLNNTIDENYYDFETKGQYIKVGANYNLFNNWLDMENEIFLGLRYGYSSFSQNISNYTINSDPILPEYQVTGNREYNGLNASWGELVIGMKAEVFNNIFLGFTFSGKKMISTKEPENFKNFFVPGFNRVYLADGGIGFNYTISYRLPIYKKEKSKVKKLEKETKKNESNKKN